MAHKFNLLPVKFFSVNKYYVLSAQSYPQRKNLYLINVSLLMAFKFFHVNVP